MATADRAAGDGSLGQRVSLAHWASDPELRVHAMAEIATIPKRRRLSHAGGGDEAAGVRPFVANPAPVQGAARRSPGDPGCGDQAAGEPPGSDMALMRMLLE